jgi:hypothetical protein
LITNRIAHPNLGDWDLRDVENWFETEGSAARRTGIILITQKRKKPLQKLRRALKRHAGMTACPILR